MMAGLGPVMEPSCLRRRSALSLLDSKDTGATVSRMTPLTKTTRQQTNKQAKPQGQLRHQHTWGSKRPKENLFSMSLSWCKNPWSSRSNPPLELGLASIHLLSLPTSSQGAVEQLPRCHGQPSNFPLPFWNTFFTWHTCPTVAIWSGDGCSEQNACTAFLSSSAKPSVTAHHFLLSLDLCACWSLLWQLWRLEYRDHLGSKSQSWGRWIGSSGCRVHFWETILPRAEPPWSGTFEIRLLVSCCCRQVRPCRTCGPRTSGSRTPSRRSEGVCCLKRARKIYATKLRGRHLIHNCTTFSANVFFGWLSCVAQLSAPRAYVRNSNIWHVREITMSTTFRVCFVYCQSTWCCKRFFAYSTIM